MDSGESLTVKTDGRVELWEPGDGTSRLRARGQTLFYFLPGDQNPAGEGNGLFLVHGQSTQTLDLGLDLVTSFEAARRLSGPVRGTRLRRRHSGSSSIGVS